MHTKTAADLIVGGCAYFIVLHEAEVFQRIYDGCFLFLGANHHSRIFAAAFPIVFVLMDAQLFPYLADKSGVNFEAVLVLHILLDIIIAVNRASIGLQVGGIHGNAEVVFDFFPT